MSYKVKILFFILVNFFSQNLKSQPGIKGQITIDTSIWTPIAYLSLITDFDEMYTMTSEMILDTANINKSGEFNFNTHYLPDGDNLLRVHICKKNSPPASLIIGGDDENHFFIIANNKSQTIIRGTNQMGLFKDVRFEGYYPNLMLQQIDKIANYLDTTSFNGSQIKIELIRNAIFEKLRHYADTCSNPIVSLYALYKSKFEKDYSANQLYYKNFLLKWKQERSTYFIEFRKKIPAFNNSGIWLTSLIGGACLIIGFLLSLAYLKLFKKNQNLLRNLSVQERKIFALIFEGKSNKEISEILNIGLSTVKSHVNSVYSKLDINSRKDVLNLNLDK